MNTGWSINRDMLLRRAISLPAGTTNVRVFITIDNDFVVFWNGVQIDAKSHDECAVEFVVPIETVTPGTNLLAIRAIDRGRESFVDARITATLPPPPPPEGPTGNPTCSDGVDNDGDTLVDGADPDCRVPEGPPGDATCSDGADNDFDGSIDGNDPDCQLPIEGPFGNPTCSDGEDNDGDTFVDGEDPDCQRVPDPTKIEGPPDNNTCRDIMDNDGDLLIDTNDPDCQEPEVLGAVGVCADGVDNDGDTPSSTRSIQGAAISSLGVCAPNLP